MSTEADAVSGAELDAELAELLDVETFEPPAGFREQALLKDPAVYEQAASDPQAWWVAQAEELDWFQKWNRVLDDDDPPFYKWFVGGSLNVSYNCLDRHVIAGRGDAGLRPHWSAAQRRLRRLLRGGRARAHGVLRGQGADHRRWRRPQGQDGCRQGSRGRGDGRSGHAREDRRGQEQGNAM